MGNRQRMVPEASRLAVWQLMNVGRELRIARIATGKRLVDVARVAGTSASQLSRIERGKVPSVSYQLLVRIGAVVGLKVSIRAFPGRRRLLDKPQLELFHRLRARAHQTVRWETEVPVPIVGDFRAADARATMPGCTLVFELMTRLSDFQAQSRAAQLKQRDFNADRLILVLFGSTANRLALREAGHAAQASYPLRTKQVLKALAGGEDPGANGIVLL